MGLHLLLSLKMSISFEAQEEIHAQANVIYFPFLQTGMLQHNQL